MREADGGVRGERLGGAQEGAVSGDGVGLPGVFDDVVAHASEGVDVTLDASLADVEAAGEVGGSAAASLKFISQGAEAFGFIPGFGLAGIGCAGCGGRDWCGVTHGP
ncbi:hypothetical protein GCM10010842_29770 [Deinococcus daejeonensis]|uniref:Uncharacterized protein n=1 Tax=Deinococcus daejeonensis TaxID=1007098 RepID=A0ABQ2JC94_9DEIO|nr:hypothetical protein GCM10010842_29770 [Deinococcus daejeonensis]